MKLTCVSHVASGQIDRDNGVAVNAQHPGTGLSQTNKEPPLDDDECHPSG